VKSAIASLLLVLSLAVAAGAPAAGPPRGQLAALTRIAAKLSGLRAARPVRVKTLAAGAMKMEAQRLLDRDYPPAQQRDDELLYEGLGLLQPGRALRPLLLAQATSNVLALYDPASRTLYARKVKTQLRQALLHELVRALADETFDLRRTTRLRRTDRDAAFAAAAAVDGDATFSTQVLGGRLLALTPRQTSSTGDPMASFLQLEQQFPDTVGMRFAATLHNLGGNDAVSSALRRLPTTTAEIFHIDDFLMRIAAQPVQLPQSSGGFSLQRSDTFGELDVRALLAAFKVAHVDVVGDGWTGGRSGVYVDPAGRSAVSLVLTWDSEQDAEEWSGALAAYVHAAFPAAAPATAACASDDTCWSLAGRGLAFAVAGTRTSFSAGPDVATADALAQAELP
jgi:hypothetical protein